MAYSTDTPPSVMTPRTGGGFSTWHYNSTDAATVVRVDGYFTDAEDLGMQVGDVITQTDLAGATVGHIYMVTAINADGSANLSDGTALVATDTD